MGNVVDRILEQWKPLQHYFLVCEIERNADMGKHISTELNPVNKIYFSFLSFILNMTNKINIQFQSEKPNIHILLPTIKSYYRNILSNFIKRAHIDDDFDFANDKTMLQRFLEVESIYLGPNSNQLIADETVTQAEAREIKKSCRNYYIELCIEIKKRFNFADFTLNAIQLLNPNSLGESVMPLIKTFPNLVNGNTENEIECEWRDLICQINLKKSDDFEGF